MGLNDNVNREFGPIDNMPTIIADGKQTPEGHTVNESDVFTEPTVAGQIPEFNSAFLISSDTVNKIGDLNSVKSTLQRNCAVCTEDAQHIDTLIPGFLNDERPVEMFSVDPSQNQYEQTMNSIDGELDASYQSLKTSTGELAVKLYAFASECSWQYNNRYVGLMSNVNRAVAKLLVTTDREDVGQVPYVFGNKQRWSALMDISLNTLSEDYCVAVGDTPPTTGFEGTFLEPFLKEFGTNFKNNHFVRTLEELANDPDVNVLHSNGVRYQLTENDLQREGPSYTPEETPSLTLGTLFRLLSSNRLVQYIAALQSVHQNRIHLLTSIPDQIKEVDESDAKEQDKISRVIELSSICSQVHFDSVAILTTLSNLHKIMTSLKCMVVSMAETQA